MTAHPNYQMPSHMRGRHNFPPRGAETYNGHVFRWELSTTHDAYLLEYMGERQLITRVALESRPEMAKDFADAILAMHQSRNQGGFSNGIPGQAAQAVSGNSGIAQSGTAIQRKQQAISAAYANQLQAAAYGSAVSGGEEQYEPLKTEGFRCGEIIAVRGWKVSPQGFLRSMSADAVWAPGEPMEGKTSSRKEHNGIYAYKKAADFLKSHADGLDIYGEVALWGDVIEHELGYRAQFAQIVSLKHFLKTPAPHGLQIKDLRDKYCPEVA